MSTTTTKKAKISKISVAIDGSDASMDAADYAISISKKYNVELYALHVIPECHLANEKILNKYLKKTI